MKIDKKLIKELVENLNEFRLTELFPIEPYVDVLLPYLLVDRFTELPPMLPVVYVVFP